MVARVLVVLEIDFDRLAVYQVSHMVGDGLTERLIDHAPPVTVLWQWRVRPTAANPMSRAT